MMTPRDAERIQAEIYRKMTADQKIDVAFGMWEFAHELNQSGWYGPKPKKTSRQGREAP